MALPPGRKPLTDSDMVLLLHNLARSFETNDSRMGKDLRQTAARLDELAKKETGR